MMTSIYVQHVANVRKSCTHLGFVQRQRVIGESELNDSSDSVGEVALMKSVTLRDVDVKEVALMTLVTSCNSVREVLTSQSAISHVVGNVTTSGVVIIFAVAENVVG